MGVALGEGLVSVVEGGASVPEGIPRTNEEKEYYNITMYYMYMYMYIGLTLLTTTCIIIGYSNFESHLSLGGL